jgi:hypothetical protein
MSGHYVTPVGVCLDPGSKRLYSHGCQLWLKLRFVNTTCWPKVWLDTLPLGLSDIASRHSVADENRRHWYPLPPRTRAARRNCQARHWRPRGLRRAPRDARTEAWRNPSCLVRCRLNDPRSLLDLSLIAKTRLFFWTKLRCLFPSRLGCHHFLLVLTHPLSLPPKKVPTLLLAPCTDLHPGA